MCLLLFQDLEVHQKLRKEEFDKIWATNPHGGGVGFYRGHEPVIYTSMLKDVTWANYERAIEEIGLYKGGKNRQKCLLLHCRVATGGSAKAMSNNHPFFVPTGTGMILAHNGTTSHEGIIRPDGWSDTRTLATCWIPEYAKEFLTNVVDMEKIQKQISPSRVAILTQWTHRLIGFPYQMDEWKRYGMFSNYIWDKKETKVSNCYSGGTGYCGWKKIYEKDPTEHGRDYTQLMKKDGHRFMSQNMAARSMFYAIMNNLSFGATILFMKQIFNDWPSIAQLKEFVNHYSGAIDAISRFNDEPIPTDWEEIWEQEFYEEKDQLMFAWMEANGIETEEKEWEDPNHPKVSQVDIEMARASEEETMSTEEAVGEFIQKRLAERSLSQSNEKTPEPEREYPVDPEFPFNMEEGQRRMHEEAVRSFGTPS